MKILTNFVKEESFIRIYEIDNSICDNLIKEFKNRKDEYSSNYHPHKKSTDLYMEPNDPALKTYATELQKCITEYEKFYNLELNRFGITNKYKDTCIIQYYKPGEGFSKWHCERAGKSVMHRVLAFMTYLNTSEKAGTEFKFQNFKALAKKGITLIWPTDFTHTHRGIISLTEEKYIITGWLSFLE